MTTAHNAASLGDIANVVLMPGDPLRARYIAQTYLNDVVQFNDVRNMLGFTGTYKGKRVSVMGSGMGIGSMGIYSHELYCKYDVDLILRVGSCGAYTSDVKLLDVILVEDSYSESIYTQTYSNITKDIVHADGELQEHIKKNGEQKDLPIVCGRIHTSDCFYHKVKENLSYLNREKNCLGVDMESFALFHNALESGKKAGCLLTVSDHAITKEKATSQQREKNFNDMIELALDSVLAFAST